MFHNIDTKSGQITRKQADELAKAIEQSNREADQRKREREGRNASSTNNRTVRPFNQGEHNAAQMSNRELSNARTELSRQR